MRLESRSGERNERLALKQLQYTETFTLCGELPAANEERFVDAALAEEIIAAQEPTSGWSAFEVWRTRIRGTQGPGPRAT